MLLVRFSIAVAFCVILQSSVPRSAISQEVDCSSNDYKHIDIIQDIEENAYKESVKGDYQGPITKSWFTSQCKTVTYYDVFGGVYVYRLEYPMRGGESIIIVDDSVKEGYKIGGWGSRDYSDIDTFVRKYYKIDASDAEFMFLAKLTYQLFLEFDHETQIVDSSNYLRYDVGECCVVRPSIVRNQYALDRHEVPTEYVRVSFLTRKIEDDGKRAYYIVVITFYPDKDLDYVVIPFDSLSNQVSKG